MSSATPDYASYASSLTRSGRARRRHRTTRGREKARVAVHPTRARTVRVRDALLHRVLGEVLREILGDPAEAVRLDVRLLVLSLHRVLGEVLRQVLGEVVRLDVRLLVLSLHRVLDEVLGEILREVMGLD